jgi:hypothetical protein
MTNEQSVIEAEQEITRLKSRYVEYLTPIAIRMNRGIEPTLEELLGCQQLGTEYFNYMEQFVGNSGLLGAHANGKWVTGFAETCHSVLSALLVHVSFLNSHSSAMNGKLSATSPKAYANMQRMVKEYLPKESWKDLKAKFEEVSLPISGFDYKGANDVSRTPKWQLVTGLAFGIVFSLIILSLAVFIPSPTPTQFFVFRGSFATALAAIAAIIPGLLNVESRFQNFSVRASGAIAVFVLIWLLNPPALIGS